MTYTERERQPDTTTHDSIPAETGKNDEDRTSGDCISRRAALETIRTMQTYKLFAGDDMLLIDQAEAQTELMMLPSAQPEQPWISVTKEEVFKAGYEGREIRFQVGGRLFAIRELAQ